MRKKAAVAALAVGLVVGGMVSPSPYVSANEELRGQMNDVQDEQEEKSKEAKNKQEEITKLDLELKELTRNLEEIEVEASEAAEELEEKEAELADLEEDIVRQEKEIAELEERISERNALLESRAVAIYEAGGDMSYLEVLLGSQSFGDFIDRMGAVTTIAEHDRSLVEEHAKDQEALEASKQAVEGQRAAVSEQKTELEGLKAELDEQQEEMATALDELEDTEAQLAEELGEISSEEEILKSQEEALQVELAAWEEAEEKRKQEAEEQRQREFRAEQKREQEQERKKREEASAFSSETESDSSSESASGSTSELKSANANQSAERGAEVQGSTVSESGFIRPAAGRVTSPFGPRLHPISGERSMHNGIDIAQGGDVPVVAAKEGTVALAEYSASYGNWVIVTHQVDGERMSTVYAHLDATDVSVGDRVEQGQTIGTMGNTGSSTGQHLHFEVHEGEWNRSFSNAVNPLNYIPH
ncbi:peptidoglycan DD-metalloendopeptidase family protein [Shouchella shacheensis]|uniref:peptidoglycan DD-metalloendopeptidase family protein n=1 Tax=Shouchella shacheensis TaxID=1649580 RepID=UPI0007401822|nr:peptidoglycan DD-metalloendopeptidase family protein [Shouchella shacheensis]